MNLPPKFSENYKFHSINKIFLKSQTRDVFLISAGVSGLSASTRLTGAGIKDFVILEAGQAS